MLIVLAFQGLCISAMTSLLADWPAEKLAEAKASGIRLIVGMALILERHREGLLNYYRYPISTGPLEGTNNKIKTLKRQAYGYRDPEFYRLKILALHHSKYALVG